MNDALFSNSFFFNTISFDKYHYTDNRSGAPSHYFAYMISGNCRIVTDTETVEIKEGDIFYIPNNCSYRSYWYGTPNINFISLGFVYFPNFENKKYSVQVLSHNENAIQLMFSLSKARPLTAETVGEFYTLAGMLIPTMLHTVLTRSEEIVLKTREYLISHPYANAPELAKNCTISEAALYAAFKKASDTTPNMLKNELLLKRAKELLISTDKSIECVSNSLCFSSASRFRKKFKAYFGMTPTEMRKKFRI